MFPTLTHLLHVGSSLPHLTLRSRQASQARRLMEELAGAPGLFSLISHPAPPWAGVEGFFTTGTPMVVASSDDGPVPSVAGEKKRDIT